jgi:acetyltransferase-like isoleucine patch superfamily enzyme
MSAPKIHPTADVQSKNIGDGTTIWQFSIVLPGAKIGRDCNVNSHCLVENDVIMGDRVTIKCGVYVWDGLRLEDDVFVGPNATLTNDKRPRSKQYVDHPPTTLKKGCSIGAAAVLGPGLTIGEYAMIGMGAVVTKDVPAYTVWFGSPAAQKGFICACKEKLAEPFVCKNCGTKYEQHDGGLRPIK